MHSATYFAAMACFGFATVGASLTIIIAIADFRLTRARIKNRINEIASRANRA